MFHALVGLQQLWGAGLGRSVLGLRVPGSMGRSSVSGQALRCWQEWEPSIPGFSLSPNSCLSPGVSSCARSCPSPDWDPAPSTASVQTGGSAAPFPACKAREQLQGSQGLCGDPGWVHGASSPWARRAAPAGSPSPSRRTGRKWEKAIIPLCVQARDVIWAELLGHPFC